MKKNAFLLRTVLVGCVVALTSCMSTRAGSPGYAAHEWGTFTSIQGPDGVPLDWRASESSDLPPFVYNWLKPGSGRVSTAPWSLKGALITRQRMETPVIYFYPDRPGMTVDVTVKFPKGIITEWYPQAAQIGPSRPVPEGAANPTSAADSRIVWKGVSLVPPGSKAARDRVERFPSHTAESHYFAARKTEAAPLAVQTSDNGVALSEQERFLFYRGAGTFDTPLQVTMTSDTELTLVNSGQESLPHLFVLQIRDGKGTLIHVPELPHGENRKVSLQTESLPQNDLSRKIATAMTDALASEGLFPREAAAMVETWKDSWFTEEGVRVLYILPRAWTDSILPIAFAPEPRDLVRVMVGRAEIIAPAVEQHLRHVLTKVGEGADGAGAVEELTAELKKLGRFAEPALRLAAKGLPHDVTAIGWKSLNGVATAPLAITTPPNPSTPSPFE